MKRLTAAVDSALKLKPALYVFEAEVCSDVATKSRSAVPNILIVLVHVNHWLTPAQTGQPTTHLDARM
ncbi:hypothetical protein ColTof4_14403 [Colletotrichum tofieldiae]|nr:hypothetical protein ColTof3_14877 [Colletotrichum tofieldiae]GKT81980.1 hypothetical protein ColTof4_14403 [Colletotrichum tofieldiae]